MKLFYGDIFPEIRIDDEEQQHILKVLRMKSGDVLSLTDGKGNLAHGKLRIEGKKALLEDSHVAENLSDFHPKLHIAIAPTKNIDRIDFFVEKATEMGISEISFLNTDNSERRNLNIEKIRKKVIAACKQSLRTHFPKVNDMVKFKDLIRSVHPGKTFVAHCDASLERSRIQDIEIPDEITVLIGPEGDFSRDEINILSDIGIGAITLGSQRLRTETAGLYVTAWIYSKMG